MNAVVQPNTEPMLLRRCRRRRHLTLNRPGQFNAPCPSPCSKPCWAELRGHRRRQIGAGGGAGGRRQGPSAPGTTSGNARQLHQGFPAGAVPSVRQGDDADRRHAPAGGRPHPRHRHRGGLPAGVHVRSGGGVGRGALAVSGINVGLSAPRRASACRATWAASRLFEMLVTGDFIDAAEAKRVAGQSRGAPGGPRRRGGEAHRVDLR